MRPIRLEALSSEQLRELDELYHRTRRARLRTRVQMILLAAERGMVAAEIATIVRANEETVGRWFARYLAEGVEGPRMHPARALRRRPQQAIESGCSRSPGVVPAPWACPSCSGPRRAWRTIWPSGPGCV